MANAVEQFGGRASDGSVLPSDHTLLGDYTHLPEQKFPVSTTRGGCRVTDEIPTSSGRSEHDSEHLVGHVNAVGDDLHCHPWVHQRRARQAGRGGRTSEASR